MEKGKKELIRSIVRGVYDVQKLRMSMGNRITRNFKAKLGMEDSVSEEQAEKDAKDVLAKIKVEYKLITNGVIAHSTGEDPEGETVIAGRKVTRKNFQTVEGGIISEWAEFSLVEGYMGLWREEKAQFASLEKVLSGIPIYERFLKGVTGVGPAMAGVLISELDPHRMRHPSSAFKYAGLDVGPDGRGRSRRKEHLVEQKYTDADGNEQTKMGLGYNPFLKTKLMGVLASSFLRSRSPYSDIYYNFKTRYENAEEHKEKTKGHRHNMAMRAMVKLFLADFWAAWRQLEGYEIPERATYAEAYLGKAPHGGIKRDWAALIAP